MTNLLPIKKALEITGVKDATLRIFIKSSDVKYIKKANKYFIYEDSLLDFMKTKRFEECKKVQNIRNNSKNLKENKILMERIFNLYKDNYSFKDIKGIIFNEFAISMSDKSNLFIKRLLKSNYPDYFNNEEKYHFKLNPLEKENFKKAYEYYRDEMVSLDEISKKFDINVSNCSKFMNYCKRSGFKIRTNTDYNTTVTNTEIFKEINSEISAYLLGFFAADGHIEKSSIIHIGTSIQDAHICELFNNIICSGKGKIYVKDNIATLRIHSVIIGKDIYSLGFDNNKTQTWKSLPKINKEFMPHFIRGYFDGDGSISLKRRKNGKYLDGYNRRFCIVSFNKSILEEIISEIGIQKVYYNQYEIGEIEIKGRKTYSNGSWKAEIADIENLKKVYNYLYNEANYYFKRKKDNFELALKTDNQITEALQGNLY